MKPQPGIFSCVMKENTSNNEADDDTEIKKNGGIRPGKKWPQYLAGFLATLCTVCAGSVMGWTSPALPYLQQAANISDDGNNFPTGNVSLIQEIGVTATEASWIGSLAPLGALVGALSAGHVANLIGRKKLLLLLTGFYLVGWTLIIIAGRAALLIYIARFISGIGVGAGSVITPIYCEEIAEVSIRGSLGILFDLQVGNGILWAYVIGAYLPYFWFCITSAIIPAVFFLSFIWMPESPMYLASKGLLDKAEQSLRWLRGAKYIKGYDVKPELERIHQFVTQSIKETTSCEENSKDITTRIISKLKQIPKYINSSTPTPTSKAIKIVACLMILRQLCGINAVIFYTVDIFRDAGSPLSPFVATIIIGVIQVVATYVSSLLVERLGRRVLLLFSDVTMAISHIAFAAYFCLKQNGVDVKAYGWLPLACLATFTFVFNLGFGPLPWVMMAELVPNESKSWASGLGVSVNWILVFVVTFSFGSMIDKLGPVVTFGIFGGMCTLGIVIIAIIVPETKGKTREEIQRELCKK